MYMCTRGHKFEEPTPLYDPDYGWIGVCPDCKTDDFEEIARCDGCGETFSVDEMESGFCPECRTKVLKRFQREFAKLFMDFDDDEKRLLAETYWSVSIFECV